MAKSVRSNGYSVLSDSFRTAVLTARANPPQTNARTPSMVTQVAVVMSGRLRIEEEDRGGRKPRVKSA